MLSIALLNCTYMCTYIIIRQSTSVVIQQITAIRFLFQYPIKDLTQAMSFKLFPSLLLPIIIIYTSKIRLHVYLRNICSYIYWIFMW